MINRPVTERTRDHARWIGALQRWLYLCTSRLPSTGEPRKRRLTKTEAKACDTAETQYLTAIAEYRAKYYPDQAQLSLF